MALPHPALDPIVFRLWQPLHAVTRRPRQVHRLTATSTPWIDDQDAHIHETPTLELCVAGMLRFRHGGGTTDLSPGEAMIIEPGVWHVHVTSRPGTVTYSQGHLNRRTVWSLHDAQHFGGRFALPLEPTRTLLDRLLAEGSPEARCRQLTSLIDTTMETIAEVPIWDSSLLEMWNTAWRGLGLRITAAEVLAASGLSARHAHRCFVTNFGETPKQMILRCRLELAKAHLRHGTGVAKAATAAGFRNRADLTRHWRRRFGCPPRAWDGGEPPRVSAS